MTLPMTNMNAGPSPALPLVRVPGKWTDGRARPAMGNHGRRDGVKVVDDAHQPADDGDGER